MYFHKVGSGEGRVFVDPTSTSKVEEVVSDRHSARGKTIKSSPEKEVTEVKA